MTIEARRKLLTKMSETLPSLRAKLNLTQEELSGIIGVSRYTIMSIEKKQRPMTWNTFLSLILFFSKNDDTNMMLGLFEIYTDELNEMLKMQNNK